jgi:hypothetical protein
MKSKDLKMPTREEIENWDGGVIKRVCLVSHVEQINETFGIELNWGEIAGLRHYINCFRKSGEGDITRTPEWDAAYFFMLDYFGLDMIELGDCDVQCGRKRTQMKQYGSDWLGDERFKKYCRENVDLWRDERNLL